MSEKLQELQKDYEGTLRTLLALNGVQETERGLTYTLESATSAKLHPTSHWFVSGISGSGKSTITGVLETYGFKKLPNVTTRSRRSEERESDYVFTDESTFRLWESEGLLFHPHARNKVMHAIRHTDLAKLRDPDTKTYMDKSAASLIEIMREVPEVQNDTFIYLMVPTLQELYARILDREQGSGRLSEADILERFGEEIQDLKRTSELPYAYIVNDSRQRVETLIENTFN